MSPDSWVTALAVICSVIIGIVAGVAYMHRLVNSVQVACLSALSSAEKSAAQAVQTVGEMARKDNETLSAVEGKARHDLANRFQAATADLDNDIERLKEKAATRDEMRAMEARFNAMVTEIKQAIVALTDKVSVVAEVQAQSKLNGAMLERLLSRTGWPSPEAS
jgi:hypothetical protein